jgi:hypothetical protein
VKGFNHLVAAALAADPIVEGGIGSSFCRATTRTRPLPWRPWPNNSGSHPSSWEKLNEGGALVHARGRTWGQLIFQDLFKKER